MRNVAFGVALLAMFTITPRAWAKAPEDHFKCYQTRARGFEPVDVDLVDDLVGTGATSATVVKPKLFCNPVDKNGEGITDPTAHLMCYKIDEPKFTPRDVVVTNQFGEQTLTVTKPYQLCQPAGTDAVPARPLNHFKCYKVRRARGAARLPRRTVSLVDEFTASTATVGEAKLLCNPVIKNDEGIINSDNHLLCYEIKEPRLPRRDVDVADQFGALPLTVTRARLLCVPSSKTFAGCGEEFYAQMEDFNNCLTDGVKPEGVSFRVFHHDEDRLQEAVRISETREAGDGYPVGTILAVNFAEAMVKRGGCYNPEGRGWEFFTLTTFRDGRFELFQRGREEVVNVQGSCQGCHEIVASPNHDLVCDFNVPLTMFLTEEEILGLQAADPRCSTDP